MNKLLNDFWDNRNNWVKWRSQFKIWKQNSVKKDILEKSQSKRWWNEKFNKLINNLIENLVNWLEHVDDRISGIIVEELDNLINVNNKL